jgi:ribonuclease-3
VSAQPRISTAQQLSLAEALGYEIKDRGLLRDALTHSSAGRQKEDYQRLEFLGDRILALVIAEELYRQNPNEREGTLSSRHSTLVRGESCARVGQKLGIGQFIIMGAGEQRKNLHANPSVVGDVVEALIAAIYLDGGLEEARKFVLANWAELIADRTQSDKDPKTRLQEWALGRGMPIPAYRVVSRDGPEHLPVFTAELMLPGRDAAVGSGSSKRAAEQAAANTFLRREGLTT